MKFNVYLPEETRTFLEDQYKSYIKNTPMTKKEQRAVREWVKDGHSVYENSSGAWYDGGVPIEFLTIYRDEEYIRTHTKRMSSEETRRFAMNYYGWDDDAEQNESVFFDMDFSMSSTTELPFG